MAATEIIVRSSPVGWGGSLWRLLRGALHLLSGGLAGSLAAPFAAPVHAATLPEDKAETLYHSYSGGGVQARGPALLVRKSIADKVSLSAQYYVDAVSNASIDVVTTASPFKETRTAYEFGATTVVRDSTLSMALSRSREPDYLADAFSVDATHEVFGGMTTVSLGFSRGGDRVGKKNVNGWIDQATHWQYRSGVTQILSPRWLVSLNAEAINDSGYLGSPYRAARVFGAAVPESNPRTRSSRALKLSTVFDSSAWLNRSSIRGEVRHYTDNWDIRGNTTEVGASKYFGDRWLLDASVRLYSQSKASFYSDNAQAETRYVSRNRQLGTFRDTSLGSRLTYDWPSMPAGSSLKLTASYERISFRFSDFTDLRTQRPYSYDANVLQFYASATF